MGFAIARLDNLPCLWIPEVTCIGVHSQTILVLQPLVLPVLLILVTLLRCRSLLIKESLVIDVERLEQDGLTLIHPGFELELVELTQTRIDR